MKKWIASLFIIMLISVGCSNGVGTEKSESIEPLKVEVKTAPEVIKINEEIEISAIVTQGKDKVDDANEVKFEVWKKGEDNHKMIVATHTTDGTYVMKNIFESEGIYYIVAHTTARSLHEMPKVDVQVVK